MALMTLASQAYGAGNRRMCRVYLYRQFFLNTILFLVFSVPILFVKPILLAMGQPPEIVNLSAQYCYILLPSTWFIVNAYACNQYSGAHQITTHYYYSMGGAALVHALLLVVFCVVCDWGYLGVCWATSIHFVVRFVIAFWLVVRKDGCFGDTNDVTLFSVETVSDLGNQIRLGFSSLAMGIWSWWAFEIFTLIATYLSEDIISAQVFLKSLALLTFMVPIGISFACGTLIGNFIGSGDVAALKYYYKISMFIAAVVAFLTVIVFWFLQNQIIAVFTDLPGIVEQMKIAWPMLMLFMVFDTI